MLDLNIDVISVRSFSYESSDHPKLLNAIEKLAEGGAGTQRDDSGTSISSVINADEATGGDTYSSSTFNFNRSFNQPKWATHLENSVRSTELVTRQLFPVKGGVKNYEFSSIYSSATSLIRPQWLNLSAPDDHQLIIFDDQKPQPPQPQVRKSWRGPKSRSSEYRGVTFYRRTGRWESHIWDCGKQVYLGGFDTAHAAARAYDRAAVKFRGVDADINFTISDYEDDLKQMKDLTKEEFVLILRRQSTGLCRGSSKYRGVPSHECGRWGARMGQFLGKKAYNKAAIECNGEEAVTNFDRSTYEGEVSLVNNNQDRYHNLDLNLWISPPSGDQKGNDNVRSLHLRDAAYGLPGGKRRKVESLVSAPVAGPHALTNGIKSPSHMAWHLFQIVSEAACVVVHTVITKIHLAASIPQSSTERTEGNSMIFSIKYLLMMMETYFLLTIKKMEAKAVPSPGFSNWAWQMNSHSMVTPMPPFSTAASSGFSSTTTTPVFSGSLLSLNTQNKKLSFITSQ